MEGAPPLQLGFLPASVLQGLADYGNWKGRSAAVEQLQRALAGLADKGALRPQLPALLALLLQLLGDHNFKVAAAGLDMLAELAADSNLGPALARHTSVLAPALLQRLLDARVPVPSAALRACAALAGGAQGPLLQQLLQEFDASASLQQQDASGLLELVQLVLLRSPQQQQCMPAIAKLLLACSSSDGSRSSRQQALALEGLALAADVLGPGLSVLLREAGASEPQLARLMQQAATLQRPTLGGDGVHHGPMVPAAAAAADSSSGGGRFVISAGGSGRGLSSGGGGGLNASAVQDLSLSQLTGLATGVGTGAGAAGGGGSGGMSGSITLGPASHLLLEGAAAPRPGLPPHQQQQQQQQQQQLPPGSLGALTAHAQLLQHASSSFAAATGALASSPDSMGACSIASAGCRTSCAPHRYGDAGFSTDGSQQQQGKAGTAAGNPAMSALRSSGAGVRGSPQAAALEDADALSSLRLSAGSSIAASRGLLPDRACAAASPACSEAGSQAELADASSSWTSAASHAWTQQLEGLGSSTSPCCSGRAETMSPSRGERLAMLKRRQTEKRTGSASGSRPPWADGQEAGAPEQQSAAGPRAGTPPSDSAGAAWVPAGDGSSGRAAAPLLSWHLPLAPNGQVVPLSSGDVSSHASTHQRHQQQPGQQLASSSLLQCGGSGISSSLAGDAGMGPLQRNLLRTAMPAGTLEPGSLTLAQRSVSAAAVLCGGAAQQAAALGSPSSGTRVVSSPLQTAGRRGLQQQLGGSPGLLPAYLVPPSSASPVVGRTAQAPSAGSPLHRAQTAAAAVSGMQEGPWCESPVGGDCSSGGRRSTRTAAAGLGGGERRGWSRPGSVGGAEADAELAPLPDPAASLRQLISKCLQSNSAARKELDWQGQLDALMDARRLVAHHPEVLRPAAHELVLAVLPAVDELRSTTARVALQLFQELPAMLGRSLERDLDDVVSVLLKKAGELSTAGRDNFLAAEADKALSAVCACVSEGRALAALLAAGLGHKSPHVRCRAAAHLDGVAAGGAGLEGVASSNWPLTERLFKAAAALLQEGSLDTRTYGKRLLWAVKLAVRGGGELDRLVAGVSPEALQQRVVEVVDGLAGPPPPPTPSRAATAAGGSRLGCRGSPIGGVGSPLPGGSSRAASPATSCGGLAGAGAVGSPESGSSSRRSLFAGSSAGSSGGAAGASAAGGCGLQVQGAAAVGARRRSTAEGAPGSPGVGGSRASWGGAAAPSGPEGPMPPELAAAVDLVTSRMGGGSWQDRSDALRALAALLPALPEVPDAPLAGLLQALLARLADGNAKVALQALQVLGQVLPAVRGRCQLVLPSLVAALAASLGSSSEPIRSAAGDVLAALPSAADAAALLPALAQAALGGSARAKPRLIEQLAGVVPLVHRYQPQLVLRQAVPAALTLALEARGEPKQAVVQLLGTLAALLGLPALLSQAAAAGPAFEGRVRELLPGCGSGPGRG